MNQEGARPESLAPSFLPASMMTSGRIRRIDRGFDFVAMEQLYS
jgi:hypothetical protein